MPYDYVIVGTGLTGATIARILTDRGRRVLCFDRRSEIGGNCADHQVNGTWVHKYGPHLFRTQSTRVWEFVNRFAKFREYRHSVVSLINGEYKPWPPVWGEPEMRNDNSNFRTACLSRMSLDTYYTYVKPYTEKQWGMVDTLIPAKLANRFAHHSGTSPHLHPKHRYQGLPVDGYSAMVRNILNGVKVVTGVDISHHDKFDCPVVYSGDLSAYFRDTPLPYRCQDRRNWYGVIHPHPQVNIPDSNNADIRIINWGKISGSRWLNHTTIETPRAAEKPDEYEYPMWDESKYREYKSHLPANVIPCGRLGTYRYLDMDQAIAAAMYLAERL